MKQVISKISKSIIPTDAEIKSKKKISDIAFRLVKKEIEKFPEVIGLEFGGSFAKNTWLPKDADIDIFIRFKKNTSNKKFERISRIVGFESMKNYEPYVRYSEHPYVEAKIEKTKINIVPFYDVEKGNWKSAADRSPHHTRFMEKSLSLKMRNDVRILKTFLKANKIYGAEIAKQGFSGYISEVLIWQFGSFENVIRAISEIKEGQIVGKTPKKFETSIVIIDPIDSDRNLAAAVSDENLGRFVILSRIFLENPTLDFFKTDNIRKTENYWENLLVIKFGFKIRSPDIIWGQIKRSTTSLGTQLELNGFKVIRSKAYTDEEENVHLFFFLESMTISSIYKKEGPSFFRKNDSNSFITKNLKNNKMIWVGQNGKINSLEKRKHIDASKFMKEFLKNNLHSGIPRGLQKDLENGYKVSKGVGNLSKSIKEVANDLISSDESVIYYDKEV